MKMQTADELTPEIQSSASATHAPHGSSEEGREAAFHAACQCGTAAPSTSTRFTTGPGCFTELSSRAPIPTTIRHGHTRHGTVPTSQCTS